MRACPGDWTGLSIHVPVHLYQGDADMSVPMHHAEDLRRRLPNAELHVLPGEGHFTIFARAGEALRVASGG